MLKPFTYPPNPSSTSIGDLDREKFDFGVPSSSVASLKTLLLVFDLRVAFKLFLVDAKSSVLATFS